MVGKGSNRNNSKRMAKKKDGGVLSSWKTVVLVILMLLVGVALFLYPVVSNYFAQRNQSSAIEDYDAAVAMLDETDYQAEWDKAVRYNESLTGDPVHDPFLEGSGFALPQDYLDVLNVGGTMGSLDIPKIGVHLPIYHGTEPDTLKKGVGHIRQTAMPIGGEGTHSVLTGHRGLPSAELFTRLDELREGDLFVLSVLGEKLAYRVDAINVVLPNEIELLDPVAGEDHVTLITCTPYGVNDHRLLVRGIRTEYVEAEAQAQSTQDISLSANEWILLVMAGSALGAVIVFAIGRAIWKKRAKRRLERKASAPLTDAEILMDPQETSMPERRRYWWDEDAK